MEHRRLVCLPAESTSHYQLQRARRERGEEPFELTGATILIERARFALSRAAVSVC